MFAKMDNTSQRCPIERSHEVHPPSAGGGVSVEVSLKLSEDLLHPPLS